MMVDRSDAIGWRFTLKNFFQWVHACSERYPAPRVARKARNPDPLNNPFGVQIKGSRLGRALEQLSFERITVVLSLHVAVERL